MIHALYDVISHTWPAADTTQLGPFTIRRGAGGGSRVSATTLNGTGTATDIAAAEKAMTDLAQPKLFMIREGQEDFDAQLDAMGYVVRDISQIYCAPIADLLPISLPNKTCFGVWPPLATQIDIWKTGGIGPERLAVMDRANGPKTTFLGRINERPAGTVYAAIHDGIAMLHALEIHPDFRRQGLGSTLTQAIIKWAETAGATYFSLIATQANQSANALYTSLGMTVVGQYHYRFKAEE